VSLRALCTDAASDIGTIAVTLDELDAATRLAEVRSLDRDAQRRLYDKAAASSPIDLAHFVGNAGPLEEVIHDGLNTLPLPSPLRRFQKRFCRPADGGQDRLFGYNEGPTRHLAGPGYFVAVPTRGRTAWELRGAVVIDYFQIPDGAVAPGWPRVVANDDPMGISRFVYHETRDFMRRVTKDVAIGVAYSRERTLDHYFVLCRQV
jgi:hypothetical protein